jgi:hypothetical protein
MLCRIQKILYKRSGYNTMSICLFIKAQSYTMNSKLDKYHAMLYELDGYVGREGFPLETTWMVGLNGDTLFDVMGSRELTCSIVGFVSSNNLKMEAHGNFIPHGPPSDKKTIKQLINAAMEFRLTRPPDRFKTFQEEFDNAIQNLYVVSKGISEDGKTSKLISYASNDSPELLFSKSIFCAHVCSLVPCPCSELILMVYSMARNEVRPYSFTITSINLYLTPHSLHKRRRTSSCR